MEGLRWSAPVDDLRDTFPNRSSQRAELLAAIEGVMRVTDVMEDWESQGSDARRHAHGHVHGGTEPKREWVITTDSEYVVKGMTEWFPQWRASIPFLQSFVSHANIRSSC